MGFCQQCRSLLERRMPSGYHLAFHHDAASLKKAVEERCFACFRIWNNLSKEQQIVASRAEFDGFDCHSSLGPRSHARDGEDEDEESILANFSFTHGEDLYDCDDYNDLGWAGCGGQFAVLNPFVVCPKNASMLSASTGDQRCWDQVASWIDKCCSEHEACTEPQPTEWAPTRLVDVSGYESGVVRIVASSAIPNASSKRYVALSHCWGKEPFLVMSKHNREEFETSIVLSSLPPNFQDAIFATSTLGISYIWIDSLCIVQGCEKDWQAEAPMMNRIYRHAFLTLAAAASADAHGGLFRTRDQDLFGAQLVTIDTEAEGILECLMVHSDLWETEIKRAPLNKRAWVVQERILAPRTLYFARSQLFWECRGLQACEVLPRGIPPVLIPEIRDPDARKVEMIKSFESIVNRLMIPAPKCDEIGSGTTGPDWAQYETVYGVWNDILATYTRCALTNPDDKFVAISGVVQIFAKAARDEYVAGLWRGNFINGLLWQVIRAGTLAEGIHGEPDSPAHRAPEYRAPSWSWASVDGPTCAHPSESELCEACAEVCDITVVPKGSDPFGELAHACLNMRGHLIKTWRRPGWKSWWSISKLKRFGGYFPDVDGEAVDAGHYYCLPLRVQRNHYFRSHGEETRQMHGLVLTVVTDGAVEFTSCCRRCSGKLLMTRVGTFEMDEGEPIQYLGMYKPGDWDDSNHRGEKHLWYEPNIPLIDFAII